MDPGVTHYALWTLLETVNWSGYISNHFYVTPSHLCDNPFRNYGLTKWNKIYQKYWSFNIIIWNPNEHAYLISLNIFNPNNCTIIL